MGPHHAASRFYPLMASSRRPGAMVGAAGDIPDVPTWYRAFAAAGALTGAYHGLKRNDSIGWAVMWGVLGGLFPMFVIPIAFAQGIDKRK